MSLSKQARCNSKGGSSSGLRVMLVGVLAGVALSCLGSQVSAQPNSSAAEFASPLPQMADTALIVSVDISNSVNVENFKLQMEGIASALEDAEVIKTISSGPNGHILFSLVTWSTEAEIAVPWTKLSSASDGQRIAKLVRALPRSWTGGEATCVGTMFDYLRTKLLAQVQGKALRRVVDVSGDGPDNCSGGSDVSTARDKVVASGVTVNGLPILDGAYSGDDVTVAGWRVNAGKPSVAGEALKAWYSSNVKGGPGSFILPAQGFSDFARAIRRKFVMEISMPDRKEEPAGGLDLGGVALLSVHEREPSVPSIR